MVSPPLGLAQVEVFGVSFDLSPMAACPVGRTQHGDVFPGTILNTKFLFLEYLCCAHPLLSCIFNLQRQSEKFRVCVVLIECRDKNSSRLGRYVRILMTSRFGLHSSFFFCIFYR